MADINGKTILLIGSGPQTIGQSGQTDEGMVAACQTLTDQGLRVIVVNPNPDALATDPDLAHRTYIEPLTVESLTHIFKKEKPDALLPAFGGREALHQSVNLNIVHLITPLLLHRGIAGHIGQSLDRPHERYGSLRNLEIEGYTTKLLQVFTPVGDRIIKAGHARTILQKPFQINISNDDLLFVRKALGLRQQIIVFINKRIAIPG